MRVPDWMSSETSVLLNPRMPEPQRTSLLEALDSMPTLAGHIWLTTSGSSGIKWVALSKDAILASAQAVNQHLNSSNDDIWTLALPVFHVGGLGVLARGFLSGAPVHRYTNADGEPRWNAVSFYAFLQQTKTTLTTLVPTQLHDLLQAGFMSPPALRAVVIGGGALDPALYRAARRLGWPVLPSYGLSECCSQVATAALDSLESETDDSSPPLVLLSHVTAQISEEGRIMVQSPSLLTGYGLIEPSRFVDPKEDGWFLTEDRGTLAGSALTIQGRIGDFVKIGGESVDVSRLVTLWAQVQSSQSGLPETALIAVPDTRLGAAIHLASTGGAAAHEQITRLVDVFNKQVLPFERIQTVHWIEEIPRSPLGKLLRTELLARVGYRTS
ncbi:MAG: AMP-binding protein [Janthinobacterium lividum]